MAPMRVGVVGAGPAGVTAAELLQRAGHQVTVVEQSAFIGGRTRTVEPAPGHQLDTGAAWVASFYTETLKRCEGLDLIDRNVVALPRLNVDGRLVPAPFGAGTAAKSPLIPLVQRAKLAAWSAGALAQHRNIEVAPSTADDDQDASAHVRRAIGDATAEYVFRPAFETMVFAPLDELSAGFVRTWARASLTARFSVPSGGMDEPWRRMAAGLGDVRTGVAVTAVGPHHIDPVGDFDAVVCAVPAPIAAHLIAPGTPGRPDWLDDVRYSAHVFAYAGRETGAEPVTARDTHPAGPGPHRVGSVAVTGSGDGRVPDGWECAMVSAEGPWSAELLDQNLDDATLLSRLWTEGRELDPSLFPLDQAGFTWVQRHRLAVPIFSPGHATRLTHWAPSAPLALAGDWAWYPCVEGAVRSGIRAAEAILAG